MTNRRFREIEHAIETLGVIFSDLPFPEKIAKVVGQKHGQPVLIGRRPKGYHVILCFAVEEILAVSYKRLVIFEPTCYCGTNLWVGIL